MQQAGVVTGSAGLASTPSQDSGTIALLLRTYNPNVFFEVSDTADASYATVANDDLWSGPGPVNSGYQIISDTLLACDAGTSDTIAYSDVVVRPAGHPDISYEDGAITNLPRSTLM